MFHAKMTATYLLHICESGYRRGVSWASVQGVHPSSVHGSVTGS